MAGGIPTTTTAPSTSYYNPDQWPVLLGYGAFFAALCVAGVLGGYLVERLAARRRR